MIGRSYRAIGEITFIVI